MSIDATTAMGIVLAVVGVGWIQAEWRMMLVKDRAAERFDEMEEILLGAMDYWKKRGDDYCSKLIAQIALNANLKAKNEARQKVDQSMDMGNAAAASIHASVKPRRRAKPAPMIIIDETDMGQSPVESKLPPAKPRRRKPVSVTK